MSLVNIPSQEKRMLLRQSPKLLQQDHCTTFFFLVLLNVQSLPDSVFWRQQCTTQMVSLQAFNGVFCCVCGGGGVGGGETDLGVTAL